MTQHREAPASQIRMYRSDLSDLPAIALPNGYRLRQSRPGDAAHWCRIIDAAFPEQPPTTETTWQEQILQRPGYAPERVAFIEDPNGRPCATASAMRGDHDHDGYVHWVAIDPAEAGRKLGYQATLHCLHTFAERGCTSAYLHTDTFRLPAIATYLKLGFRPDPSPPGHRQRWDSIVAALRPELADRVRRML